MFNDLFENYTSDYLCCCFWTLFMVICLLLGIILIYIAREKAKNDSLEHSNEQCWDDNNQFDFDDCSDKEIQKISTASQVFLGIFGVLFCICVVSCFPFINNEGDGG